MEGKGMSDGPTEFCGLPYLRIPTTPIPKPEPEPPSPDDYDHWLDLAWGIIANAGAGNWSRESEDWRGAAARWRDEVLPALSRRNAQRANSPNQPKAMPSQSKLERIRTVAFQHDLTPDEALRKVVSILQEPEPLPDTHVCRESKPSEP
jgi:hypothetical protein